MMIPTESTSPATDASRAVKLRTNALCIDVIRGPDAGMAFRLSGPIVTIGSSSTCNLVLNDSTVSRQHAEIRIEGGMLRVCDLDSRNGTIIDGMRVRDAYPRPDSLIHIGNSSLRLRMSSDVVEIAMSRAPQFGRLHGRSTAMRLVFALLERIAPQDIDVLLEGETGTGKELAAEAIHDASARTKRPFVILDCSAAHDNLFESELFGHARGAFTGASSARAGAFEEAHRGTIFLDEIGELPPTLQPKLLRVLQERAVRRLGENQYRKIDVRVICATNRSLAKEVDRGRFRQDLYYRLAGINVRIPPLRERLEDVPILVRNIEKELDIDPSAQLSDDFIRDLTEQSWPGNVRELWQFVRRVHAIGIPRGDEEMVQGLPPSLNVTLDVPLLQGRELVKEEYERKYIELALRHCRGNVSQAAALAGVGRKFFWRAMRRYNIRSGA